MTVDKLSSQAAALITANATTTTSPEELASSIVRQTLLRANQYALKRFLDQFELLSGGPRELGQAEYDKVLEMAWENLWEAQSYVLQQYNYDILLGPYVLRRSCADADGEELLYWNQCFGQVSGITSATGYITKDEADDARQSMIGDCNTLYEVVELKSEDIPLAL